MPSPTRFTLLLAAMLATVSCGGCLPLQATSAVGVLASVAPQSAAVTGQAYLPESLVGADGVLPTGLGKVIPTGLGQVMPTGVGKVMPTGIGTYRLAQAETLDLEWPVVGASVSVRDAATRETLPPLGAATTGEDGSFRIDGLTAGAVVLIEITFTAGPEGTPYRLLSLVRAGDATATDAVVGWASTAATTDALRAAESGAALDPVAVQHAATALLARVALLTAAERQALEASIVVTVPVESNPAVDGPVSGISQTVEHVVNTAATGVATVADTVSSPVSSILPAVGEAVNTSVAPVVKDLTKTVGTLVQGVTGTVGGKLIDTPATPRPTPTAPSAPSPQPTRKPLLPGLL